MSDVVISGVVKPLRRIPNSFSRIHPVNNKKNNEILLQHIKERLDFATPVRDSLVNRFGRIDKELSGYVVFDEEEREAERANQDGDPRPGKMVLPLVEAQLDELLTFMMSVFAPDSDLYEALADKNKQDAAAAFTLLMNKNAKIMGYYRQYSRSIGDMLKYNLGGVEVTWREIKARKPKFNDSKTFLEESIVLETVWAGNDISALDMYNVLWDISHHPTEVAQKGEFVATVKAHTEFAIRRMHQNKEITNLTVEDLTIIKTLTYFKFPPEVTPQHEITSSNSRSNSQSTGNIDWVNVLSAGVDGTTRKAFEIVTFTGWLIPLDFGLGTSKELEIWRVLMFNGTKIIAAKQLKNFHEMLPFAFASPIEDGLGLQQKTYAEKLIPLQQFGSFLINSHMASTRKALGGIQVYDPSIVPLDQVGDKISARIPIKAAGWGKPIGDAIRTFSDAPDTKDTMGQLNNVVDLMQGLLPTNIRNQVASLERATQYQAASVVQGSSMRNLKMARLINDQAWNKVRQMMLYNILQFQDTITIIDPAGKDVEVSAAAFVDFDLDYVIDEGLKSLDRLSVITFLREILNTILQSKEAQQEIDVVALLDYYTSLMGDNTDMSRFRKTPEQRQQDIALQQGQTTPTQQGQTQTI